MTESITIAAFAGSLRRKSHNRGLLRAAAEVAPAYVTINIIDLTPLPFYNAEHDGPNMSASVTDFLRQIVAADALLIAAPEYNYSLTGVLKNALDWASRRPTPDQPPAMQGKPAAIMGAGSRFGTVRAQAHLRYILLANDLKVLNKPEIMVVRSSDCFDGEGNLTDDTVRNQVEELVHALYKWTIQLRK